MIFWPRFARETLYKHAILAGTIGRLLLLKVAIAHDPDAWAYTDQALTPVSDDEDVTLDLLTKTTGARAAIAHVRKIAGLMRPVAPPRARARSHHRGERQLKTYDAFSKHSPPEKT